VENWIREKRKLGKSFTPGEFSSAIHRRESIKRYHNYTVKVKSCKEMGGATSVMAVISDAFSQWADTIDWTVRCDWLQSCKCCDLQLASVKV